MKNKLTLCLFTLSVLLADLSFASNRFDEFFAYADWGGGVTQFKTKDGMPFSSETGIAFLVVVVEGELIDFSSIPLRPKNLVTPGGLLSHGDNVNMVMAVSQNFNNGYLLLSNVEFVQYRGLQGTLKAYLVVWDKSTFADGIPSNSSSFCVAKLFQNGDSRDGCDDFYFTRPGGGSTPKHYPMYYPPRTLSELKCDQEINVSEYRIDVVYGTGSGIYPPSTAVEIKANSVSNGMAFAGWSGDVQLLEDPSAAVTTLVSSESNALVKANYKPVPENIVWEWNFEGDYTERTSSLTLKEGLVDVIDLSRSEGNIGEGAHCLAVHSDNTVSAWGSNSQGQLGDGTSGGEKLTPVKVKNLTEVVRAVATGKVSMALKSDGTVWTWGESITNTDETSNVPVIVPNLNDVIAIDLGYISDTSRRNWAIALKSDGTVWCWGHDIYGEIGTGYLGGVFLEPMKVQGLDGVVAVSAGERHAMALKSDGSIWCWGRRRSGSGFVWCSRPVMLSRSNYCIAISGGSDYSMAIDKEGILLGWEPSWDVTPKIVRENMLQVRIRNVEHQWASSFSAIGTDGTLWHGTRAFNPMAIRDVKSVSAFSPGVCTERTYRLTVENGTESGAYIEGAELTVHGTKPEGNSRFINWTGDVDYLDDPNAESASLTMPDKEVTIKAVYDKTYLLSVNDGNGGGYYLPGEKVEINARSDAVDHVFSRWEGPVEYIYDPSALSTTIVMPESDLIVSAIFGTGFHVKCELLNGSSDYTLNSLVPGEVNHFVSYGKDCTFEATINPILYGGKYLRFAGWYLMNEDGGKYLYSLSNLLTVKNVSSDTTVYVHYGYSQDLRSFEINASPPEGGTTDKGVGLFQRHKDDDFEVTAIAKPGYKFINWTGNNISIVNPDEAAIKIEVFSGDSIITANFVPIEDVKYEVTMAVNTADGGSTVPEVDSKTSIVKGAECAVKATPLTGYVFVGWTAEVGGTVVSDVFDNPLNSEAFVTVNDNITVCANFVLEAESARLTIFADPPQGGSTEPMMGNWTLELNKAISVTAEPADGYYFMGWEVSDKVSISNAGYPTSTVQLTANGTLTANFSTTPPATWTLKMALSSEGAGTTIPELDTEITVIKGFKQTISATASEGYTFVNWTSDVNAEEVPNATFDSDIASVTEVTLNADAVITANFVEDAKTVQLTIAVDPVDFGTTNPAIGTHSVEIDNAMEVTATPETGYYFAGWIVTENLFISNASSATTEVTPSGDGTITATFTTEEPVPCVLTMAVNTDAYGTTTPMAGSETTIFKGVAQTILATPASGYVFVNWTATENGVLADSESATSSVTLSGDATVTANFEKDKTLAQLTISVYPADAGTTDPAAGISTVATGTAFDITATAAANYKFDSWSASTGVTVVDTTATSTSVTVSQDGTLTANFKSTLGETATLTMKASPSGAGSTVPSVGNVSVVLGDAVDITATPATGYYFVGWSASGNVMITTANSASTTAYLIGDGTVTARFSSSQLGEFVIDKLKISMRNDKSDKDSVKITMQVPDNFSFDKDADDLILQIGDWKLQIDKGSYWKETSKMTFKDLVEGAKVKVDIDEYKKDIIVFNVKNANIAGSINAENGVDVYLVVGDDYYWENCEVDEKTRWKSKSSSNKEGFSANVLKFSGMYASKGGREYEKYSFAIKGYGLEDPVTDGFDPDEYTPYIYLDQEEFGANVDPKQKNNKYLYKDTDDWKMALLLDFDKGKWAFKVTQKEGYYVEVSRSDKVKVILEFYADAEKTYESVNEVDTTYKTILIYKR